MEKIIFLDRDGTINIEKNYLYRVEDFEFEVGVIEALSIFQERGFKIIIITNQSGIARGYYTENDLNILNQYLINLLKEKNIIIDGIYYCPHHTSGIEKYNVDCKCRKPNIGLIDKAQKKYEIDFFNSYFVGDKISDLEVAIQLGMKPILVETGNGKKEKNKI